MILMQYLLTGLPVLLKQCLSVHLYELQGKRGGCKYKTAMKILSMYRQEK